MTLKNTLLFLFFVPIILFAQRNTPHVAVVTNGLYPAEAVQTFDLRNKKEVKRVFFIEDWSEGKFLFSTTYKTNRTLPLKYDILNQELNIDMAGSIYLVPLDSIYGFELENLLSPDNYKFIIRRTGDKDAEIFEAIVEGNYQLLVKHVAEKLKPNYQPALDTGSRDEKVVKKEYFYFVDKDGRMVEIPKRKKSAAALFSSYPSAKEYLAKNKVNFKSKESLKGLFLFMNNN